VANFDPATGLRKDKVLVPFPPTYPETVVRKSQAKTAFRDLSRLFTTQPTKLAHKRAKRRPNSRHATAQPAKMTFNPLKKVEKWRLGRPRTVLFCTQMYAFVRICLHFPNPAKGPSPASGKLEQTRNLCLLVGYVKGGANRQTRNQFPTRRQTLPTKSRPDTEKKRPTPGF